ncbi:MAG: helix-turn-helix transcriptional regulator [Bacilli bacterium]|nr:helix-turn-helix transcriptional regulator [Bacilli bacterium]
MRIKELRDKKGLTQKQVAKELGTTAVTVMNWENGIYEPTIADMIKLADLFDVTMDYLVGREYDADEAAARHVLERLDKSKLIDALLESTK